MKNNKNEESNSSIMMKVNKCSYDYKNKLFKKNPLYSPGIIKPRFKKSGLLNKYEDP